MDNNLKGSIGELRDLMVKGVAVSNQKWDEDSVSALTLSFNVLRQMEELYTDVEDLKAKIALIESKKES